ncbi:hypothetical protein DZC31_30350 (plasmid) [Stenotrophomonas rhizophila]|nr:hypothetical protein DZC31_30350 [Stenotrophomonas rhizophila]
MKTAFSALLLLLCMSVNLNAATCRSGEAAVRGSNSGYEEDKRAAEQTVQDDLSFSDVLEKCVGGVTGIKAGPTYGPSESFGDWAELIFKQVCNIARDKISEVAGGGAESRMGSALENIYSGYESEQQARNSNNGGTPGYIPATSPSAYQPNQSNTSSPDSTDNSSDSAFWNTIWK